LRAEVTTISSTEDLSEERYIKNDETNNTYEEEDNGVTVKKEAISDAGAEIETVYSTTQFAFNTFYIKSQKDTSQAIYADNTTNNQLMYGTGNDDAYKICLLNEVDYRKLTGQTTVTESEVLGTDALSTNFKTVDVVFKDGVTTVTNNTGGEYYYLYFPSLGVFAKNEVSVLNGKGVSLVTLENSVSSSADLRFYVIKYTNKSSSSTYNTYGTIDTEYYTFGGYSEGTAFDLTSGEEVTETVSGSASVPTNLERIYVIPDRSSNTINDKCAYPVFNLNGNTKSYGQIVCGWGVYDWKWGTGSTSDKQGQIDFGSMWSFAEAGTYNDGKRLGTLTNTTTKETISGVYEFGVTTTYNYFEGTLYTVEGTRYFYYSGQATAYSYSAWSLKQNGTTTYGSTTNYSLLQNSVIQAVYNYKKYDDKYKAITYSYWYTTEIGGDKMKISVSEGDVLEFIYYKQNTDSGTTTITETVKAGTNDEVTATTIINNTKFYTLYSYVTNLADAADLTGNLAKKAQKANGNDGSSTSSTNDENSRYALFSGNNSTADQYSGGESTLAAKYYKNSTFYTFTLAADGTLSWIEGGSLGLDSIVEEANDHFGDEMYGEYYGTYYAYSGATITSGTYYKQYCLYRLMPNSANTAFELKLVTVTTNTTTRAIISYGTVDNIKDNYTETKDETAGTTTTAATFYTSYTATNMIANIAADFWTIDSNTTKTNAQMAGAILLMATGGSGAADGYAKADEFYTVYYDESTGTYSLRTCMSIDYDYTGTTTTGSDGKVTVNNDGLAKFTNTRMFSILKSVYGYSDNYHTGTGGTETVEICAFTHEQKKDDDGNVVKDSDGKVVYVDTKRYYTVEVVG